MTSAFQPGRDAGGVALRTTALALQAAGPAVLADTLPAWASSGISPTLPSSGSLNGQRIAQLYDLISVPAIALFLTGGDVADRGSRALPEAPAAGRYKPPQWHGNTRLEFVWTVLPLALVLTIGALSFPELQRDFTPAASGSAGLDITVTGFQFGWDYAYPQGFHVVTNGFDSAPMMIPVGKRARIRVQTRDVIHSWWVSGLMGKTDAVTGYDNVTWIEIDHPGRWRGQCADCVAAATTRWSRTSRLYPKRTTIAGWPSRCRRREPVRAPWPAPRHPARGNGGPEC